MRAKGGWLGAGVLIALSAWPAGAGATPPGKDPDPLPSNIEREMEASQQATALRADHSSAAPRTRALHHGQRGGGPRQCPSVDAPATGPCVAPDLSPNAPQRDWDRDPRLMQHPLSAPDQIAPQALAPTR